MCSKPSSKPLLPIHITKCNKGNKKHQTKEIRMEHKKNWDLEIPQPKQPRSINIYTLWEEEDKKEGTQIGSHYYETVEHEGGEISTILNGIKFS